MEAVLGLLLLVVVIFAVSFIIGCIAGFATYWIFDRY